MLHGKIRREYLFVDTLSKQVPINPRQKTQVTHVLITSAKPKVVVATQLSKTLNFFHHHEPVRCIIVYFLVEEIQCRLTPICDSLKLQDAERALMCSLPLTIKLTKKEIVQPGTELNVCLPVAASCFRQRTHPQPTRQHWTGKSNMTVPR